MTQPTTRTKTLMYRKNGERIGTPAQIGDTVRVIADAEVLREGGVQSEITPGGKYRVRRIENGGGANGLVALDVPRSESGGPWVGIDEVEFVSRTRVLSPSHGEPRTRLVPVPGQPGVFHEIDAEGQTIAKHDILSAKERERVLNPLHVLYTSPPPRSFWDAMGGFLSPEFGTAFKTALRKTVETSAAEPADPRDAALDHFREIVDKHGSVEEWLLSHNDTCPRCGAAAYTGLFSVECSAGEKCGAPPSEIEPIVEERWVRPLGVAGIPWTAVHPSFPGAERVWLARDAEHTALHPTREGAIAAWREKAKST